MQCASRFFFASPGQITARDEARFFGRLKTANNTFKRTEPARLAAIDASLMDTLARHGSRVDAALDLGISSGVTTLELMERLRQEGHAASMIGTDRSLRARLVDLPFGCRALVEPNGHVLQYEVARRPIRPWERRLDRWTGMSLLRAAVKAGLEHTAIARAARNEGSELALLSPRLRGAGGFSWREDDISIRNAEFVGRFDLVRAANLLNRHYFDPDTLREAVANTVSYLSGPGAWLLVLRTHGMSDHRGTLFRKLPDGRLARIERFGGGSEVEDLVMELGG